jgi:hypothetical protein
MPRVVFRLNNAAVKLTDRQDIPFPPARTSDSTPAAGLRIVRHGERSSEGLNEVPYET